MTARVSSVAARCSPVCAAAADTCAKSARFWGGGRLRCLAQPRSWRLLFAGFHFTLVAIVGAPSGAFKNDEYCGPHPAAIRARKYQHRKGPHFTRDTRTILAQYSRNIRTSRDVRKQRQMYIRRFFCFLASSRTQPLTPPK